MLYIITSVTQCTVQFFPQNRKRLTLYPFIKRKANLIYISKLYIDKVYV